MDEIKAALREIEPDVPFLQLVLAIIANVARRNGQFARATVLLGAVYSQELVRGAAHAMAADLFTERVLAELRAELGDAAFTEAWTLGNTMTREQAIAYALRAEDVKPEMAGQIPQPASGLLADPLTEREREILELSAAGLNSREIAERLVLSVGTIRWYLKQIYSKLDAHSRSQAIARARSLGLLT